MLCSLKMQFWFFLSLVSGGVLCLCFLLFFQVLLLICQNDGQGFLLLVLDIVLIYLKWKLIFLVLVRFGLFIGFVGNGFGQLLVGVLVLVMLWIVVRCIGLLCRDSLVFVFGIFSVSFRCILGLIQYCFLKLCGFIGWLSMVQIFVLLLGRLRWQVMVLLMFSRCIWMICLVGRLMVGICLLLIVEQCLWVFLCVVWCGMLKGVKVFCLFMCQVFRQRIFLWWNLVGLCFSMISGLISLWLSCLLFIRCGWYQQLLVFWVLNWQMKFLFGCIGGWEMYGMLFILIGRWMLCQWMVVGLFSLLVKCICSYLFCFVCNFMLGYWLLQVSVGLLKFGMIFRFSGVVISLQLYFCVICGCVSQKCVLLVLRLIIVSLVRLLSICLWVNVMEFLFLWVLLWLGNDRFFYFLVVKVSYCFV